VSTTNNNQKKECVSNEQSVCRTVCVATNQPAEREGVGPLEEKECRDCGRHFQ